MTELTKEIIEDGQLLRALWNYLDKTYESFEEVNLTDGFEPVKFESKLDFYEFIHDVTTHMIETTKTDLEDEDLDRLEEIRING